MSSAAAAAIAKAEALAAARAAASAASEPPQQEVARQQEVASSSSLPFGIETIKPGAVRSMTTDKLSSFSLGQTKKTAFQVRLRIFNIHRARSHTPFFHFPQKAKEAKEAKRRAEEEAAQAELNNWVEQFDAGGDDRMSFVRGGVQGGTASSASSRGPSAAARSMFSQPADDDGESLRSSRPPRAPHTTLLLPSPPPPPAVHTIHGPRFMLTCS